MLDLDVIVYPCPRDGTRYRAKVTEMGGKSQFPYLVDPNTKFASYESDRIVRYLFQTYGDGLVPLPLSLGPLTTSSAALASALRAGKGRQARPNLPPSPPMPLELWSYEASPFCRVVREQLCELELAHKVITVARGSSKREQLVQTAGKMQVPYIVDPNTNTQMFESSEINAYLLRTYGPGSKGVTSATDALEDGSGTSEWPQVLYPSAASALSAPPLSVCTCFTLLLFRTLLP
jgi:glutathione S-transferase